MAAVDFCNLYFLKIPLRIRVTHGARADRTFSDSIVIRVSAHGFQGYGEAVVRDYVSGPRAEGRELRREAADTVSRLLEPLQGTDLGWEQTAAYLAGLTCTDRELPFLCAVETALLDLACRREGKDAYSLLGREPARQEISYGGVVPILQPGEAEKYLGRLVSFGLPDAKVKLIGDPEYNSWILGLCRSTMGAAFDLRVDANSSWEVRNAQRLFDVCEKHGVRLVEQPFVESGGQAAEQMRAARARGFQIMADEGVISSLDLRRLASEGAYSAVNLRLAKNGGLSRVLQLAEEARANGLSCQLGCMVGETGILSALGRIAASLLPEALHVEGSYDDQLLTDNITVRSLGFGQGGKAPVIRGQALGYEVSPQKLASLSVEQPSCS